MVSYTFKRCFNRMTRDPICLGWSKWPWYSSGVLPFNGQAKNKGLVYGVIVGRPGNLQRYLECIGLHDLG